ncbi:MAG: AmmeMemoRadiSam system protein B [bacterium]
MDYARLRPVQFFPVLVDGKRMGCLHDPQRISDKPLLIPWHLVPLLSCLDGTHSLLDIQAEYTRCHGDLLFRDDLMAFLQQLDHYLFLDSERFREFQERIRQGFLDSPFRPPFFSGLSYSSDPAALRDELEGYFPPPKGPGLPPAGNHSGKISGLVAPHIDLASGGPCFARAYAALSQSSPVPALFIILGTCHAGVEGLFALTAKSFQTPLGTTPCDEGFMKLIEEHFRGGLYSEEFLHRSEHTIEFQVLFLQFIWERFGASWPPLRICPILCSFPPGCLAEAGPEREVYHSFIESVAKAIDAYDNPVCLIASADLAHLGPKFGDPRALDYQGREHCFRKDRELLDILAKQDRKGFQDSMLKDHDARRICGYPPLTALLDLLPPSRGMLLDHDHAAVDNQGSIVTFASMAFYQ